MSFILDALKKSEIDRQRQGGAEFAAIPLGPRSSPVPRWLWIVGVLLLVNLAVLIGLFFKPDSPPSLATLPVIEQNSPAAAETANTTPSSFEQQVAAARQRVPEQQLADAGTAVANRTNPTVQSVLISQNPAAVPASDRYPTLQELRASGATQLPELHLDIHVYSGTPEDRFVFINMTKLREGSQLAEGPVVAEITPDGVVLRHEGQSFLIPRE
jgi:general secretion pathway protein B